MASTIDFKPGDVVRIREWDDMAKEFGVSRGGTVIGCNGSFVDDMRHLCGTEFVIAHVYNDGTVSPEEEPDPNRCWTFSTDMIEYIKQEEKMDESEELQSFFDGLLVG